LDKERQNAGGRNGFKINEIDHTGPGLRAGAQKFPHGNRKAPSKWDEIEGEDHSSTSKNTEGQPGLPRVGHCERAEDGASHLKKKKKIRDF